MGTFGSRDCVDHSLNPCGFACWIWIFIIASGMSKRSFCIFRRIHVLLTWASQVANECFFPPPLVTKTDTWIRTLNIIDAEIAANYQHKMAIYGVNKQQERKKYGTDLSLWKARDIYISHATLTSKISMTRYNCLLYMKCKCKAMLWLCSLWVTQCH